MIFRGSENAGKFENFQITRNQRAGGKGGHTIKWGHSSYFDYKMPSIVIQESKMFLVCTMDEKKQGICTEFSLLFIFESCFEGQINGKLTFKLTLHIVCCFGIKCATISQSVG
jgi:hypothetical protein